MKSGEELKGLRGSGNLREDGNKKRFRNDFFFSQIVKLGGK
jgi:hypothetical protein